jgi:predicted TIM-barrel fold metal-dependent hydrolase
MLRAHPAEYVLFGTDSPWDDQTVALQRLRSLDLGRELEDAILSTNASRLLDV